MRPHSSRPNGIQQRAKSLSNEVWEVGAHGKGLAPSSRPSALATTAIISEAQDRDGLTLRRGDRVWVANTPVIRGTVTVLKRLFEGAELARVETNDRRLFEVATHGLVSLEHSLRRPARLKGIHG